MLQKECCHDIGREQINVGIMDGVSVAKSLHHFVEATSLCKAPFPNQRDLGETAMGHGPTSTIVGSQKVKEQSASFRESAVKFGVASAGDKESMNHLSHLLRIWVQNCAKQFCETIRGWVKTDIYIIITFGGITIHYLGRQGFDSQAIWFKCGMLSRPERLKRHWGSVQERSGKPQFHGRNRWAWRIHNAHHLQMWAVCSERVKDLKSQFQMWSTNFHSD